MKRAHIVAAVCFAAALARCALASSRQAAGRFALLGSMFELMGWRQVLQTNRDKACPSR